MNLCALLYDEVQSLVVKLPMRKSRAVAVSREGKGKIRVFMNPSTRQLAKIYPIDWPHLRPQPPPPPQAAPKLVLKPPAAPGSAKPSPPPPRKPSFSPPQSLPTPVSATPNNTGQPRTILKLKAPAAPPVQPSPPPPPPPSQPKVSIKLKFSNKSGSP
ncbi:hypothetical protein AA313_de0210074 [Arthrobotrys entomopaga]|nr:hypothetical protein AA313_de0210074 [Arthrobotrys entomopaga]